MLTKLEIIDTAVKVGLGALITGFTTYFLAKLNHDRTAEKERAERRRSLLESIAQEVATFHQVASLHWSFIVNWINFTPPGEDISEESKSEMIKMQREVLAAFKELTSAQSKLLLLGEANAHQLLSEYRKFLIVFRIDSVIQRQLEVDDLVTYQDELNKKKDLFFQGLSRAYSRH